MTTRTDAIREALARPQRPDPRVVELLEELGDIAAEMEELSGEPFGLYVWQERLAKLDRREAEITAELERLVQVSVDPGTLT